jgi:uncharacterized protein YdeI (YjbR/CyaY-like superfamily)
VEVNPRTLKFFRTAAELRRWFKSNHDKASELWIGMYIKSSGKGGVDYKQALDEALCYGWIDGIRKRLDDESFTTRFTPRKPTSIWSNVNIAHVKRLTEEGRMLPPGVAAFEKRTPERSGVYSFEREHAELPPDMMRQFKKNPTAWKFFSSQPHGYRRAATWWVISAKRDETREKRLSSLIALSGNAERLPQLIPIARRKKS